MSESKGSPSNSNSNQASGQGEKDSGGASILRLPSGLVRKYKKDWLIKSAALEFSKGAASNTTQEDDALEVIEDFRRKFTQLFPQRRPLLLYPDNEAGIPKLICSTMTPALDTHPLLYDAASCATFVSDFIDYYQLDDPVKLPLKISSPATTIRLRAGDCFDIAILLASLLKGARYKAYCVSGYAPQWITFVELDETPCPEHVRYPRGRAKAVNEAKKAADSYQLKAKRDHSTRFAENKKKKETQMSERLVTRSKRAIRAAEKKARPPDKHKGERVHCWVYVEAGQRGVEKPFFIEPTSGILYPVDANPYFGVEQVFDDSNVWVNMQGSKDMAETSMDLSDEKKWETVFYKSAKKAPRDSKSSMRRIPSRTNVKSTSSNSLAEMQAKAEEEARAAIETDVLDVPLAWAEAPCITDELYRSRLSKFTRTIQYADCLVEKWQEYETKVGGLVCRITTYDAPEEKDRKVAEVREYFEHRSDGLFETVRRPLVGETIRRYGKGDKRLQGLKELIETKDRTTFIFHPMNRPDGLVKKVVVKGMSSETFIARDDRMHSRTLRYSLRRAGAASSKSPYSFADATTGKEYSIDSIVERFARNPAVKATDDVEIRTHTTRSDCREIKLNFHFPDDGITPRCLVYNVRIGEQAFMPDHLEHKCPERLLPSKNQQLKDLAKLTLREKVVYSDIKERQKAFDSLAAAVAEKEVDLVKHIHDAARDQVVEESEEKRDDEEFVERKKPDYLQPFLVNFPDGIPRTAQQALQAKSECLAGLKDRLLERATIIQDHLDREQEALKTRNNQYLRTQTEDPDEKKRIDEEFQKFSETTMFRLSILDGRLKRHEKEAIKAYTDLDRQLREDPRLKAMYRAKR